MASFTRTAAIVTAFSFTRRVGVAYVYKTKKSLFLIIIKFFFSLHTAYDESKKTLTSKFKISSQKGKLLKCKFFFELKLALKLGLMRTEEGSWLSRKIIRPLLFLELHFFKRQKCFRQILF